MQAPEFDNPELAEDMDKPLNDALDRIEELEAKLEAWERWWREVPARFAKANAK